MSDRIAPPDRALIGRLPRTFAPALNEQTRQWTTLFPAEQRQLRAQMDWVAALPEEQFQVLFQPIVALESRMDLPAWNAQTEAMTVQDVGILARSPLYPQWRAAVEKVFAAIDDGVANKTAGPLPSRLVVCVLPAGLTPQAAGTAWNDLSQHGVWLPLQSPFREYWPALSSAILKRPTPGMLEDVEATWVLECDSMLLAMAADTPAVVLSWNDLAAVRREFLNRLNTVRRDLNSVDQTHGDLKRLELKRILSPRLNGDPRVREFVRSLLLSGNGSLVFNNSFVQWGASEAARRAQPQVLIANFGIRPKLKPFSSSVLFEDQSRSNPVADQDDVEGSIVDAAMLARYVHFAAQRQSVYQSQTLTLFTAGDLKKILLLGGPPPQAAELDAAALQQFLLGWLSRSA